MKLLKRMHQLGINLLCSSDYQTTYSFCEIKHFVKQAKSLLIHFQGLLLNSGGGGGNSHRLGYGMCHFLRVLFWLKNKFLGLFYSF